MVVATMGRAVGCAGSLIALDVDFHWWKRPCLLQLQASLQSKLIKIH